MRKVTLIVALGLLILSGCNSSGSGSNTTFDSNTTAGSTTTSRTWGTATLIENDDSGDVDTTAVALNDNGDAMAVWCISDGTRYNIWARRTSGGSWEASLQLDSEDLGDVYAPDVAMDASGNAIAVWYQYDGSHTNIWANRYVADVGWNGAEKLETDDTGSAYSPRVAFDSSGNAIVVWYQYTSTDGANSIYARRYEGGGGWGSVTKIEDASANAYSPRIAFDSSGNAMVVFHQYVGGFSLSHVFANRYSGGNWLSSAVQLDSGSNIATNPDVSFDGNGNAIVVWTQWDGTRTDLWANRYLAAGDSWEGAATIESGDGDAYDPRVAADSAGNAVAIWEQWDGTADSIMSNRYEVGSGWGTPVAIETSDESASGELAMRVAMDGSGNAIATWQQLSNGVYSTWANRYRNGSGWGMAELLENDDTHDTWTADLAVNGSGDAVVAWPQSDGSHMSVWANWY